MRNRRAFFVSSKYSSSPYINRFISPDTLIPSPANPQSWNRYSYVTNRPVNFNDPTGHMQESEGIRDNDGKCDSDDKACNDLVDRIKKKKEKGDKGEGDDGDEQLPLLTNFAGPGRIESWDGRVEIDPVEWEKLLKLVGDDVHFFSTGWKDTPFFNNYSRSGIGCFNGGRDCYDRSELNYIGEGEALAALGLSKEATHNVVWTWKNKDPFVLGLLGLDSTPREVSQGTYEMTDVGWDYYHEHYSSPSNSVISLITPPGIAPSLLVP